GAGLPARASLHPGFRSRMSSRSVGPVRNAAKFKSLDDVLTMAHRLNERLATSPKDRLADDEVVARAMKVWNDIQAGKIKPWGPRKSVVRTTKDEIERLPGDALKLISKLRAEHTARCERGETFAISPVGIAAPSHVTVAH